MISAQQLTKAYGTEVLFKEATFTVHKGERIGLVGRNGHGKTTLFRLIIGEEKPDDGSVSIPRGYRIGHITQHMQFSKPTLLEEACLGLHETEKNEYWKAEKMLMGIGFNEDDFDKPIELFSGGYHMRLALAKVLVSDPDMLLLDEPTNFLDIVSIRWLEQLLSGWRKELIVVSHDRTFMDNVVSHIVGIHRKALKKIEGTTEQFYQQIALEEEVYERNRVNQEKKQKQMQEFISKFRAKARQANLVQSRIKTLEKMGNQKKLEAIQTLSFSFPYNNISAKSILRVNELGFSYNPEDSFLIKGLSVAINKGDKVCVIGKNGKGKTTLIKLLAQDLTPLSGTIKYHPECKAACYEQAHTADLNPSRTIEEELLNVAKLGEAQRVRSVCGGMMFSGDLMQKRISVLSGGEKCRVMLGKILVSAHNLLLLDEPTQHLDMESCDAIVEAVEQFEGAAVIVTHDERFLYRVATKLIVFQHDQVRVFPGTYEEFLQQIGWEDEQTRKEKPAKTNIPKSRKEKQARAAFVNERSKALKPLEKKIQQIEKDISRSETELDTANKNMLQAVNNQESDRIQTLAKRIHDIKIYLEGAYAEWTRIHDEFERTKKKYEQLDGLSE